MELRVLFEKEIRSFFGPREALEAVREGFVQLARGEAILPAAIGLEIPETGAEAHVKGAYLKGAPYFSFKAAAGAYDNPSRGLPVGGGLVLVFDATTGLPAAVLFDNGYLTDLRTGAAGGLAADLLAKRDVRRVGILGPGTQGRYQLEALLVVRKPEAVVVWGRSPDKAKAYAQEMETRLGIPMEVAASPEDAVRGSDIVITATPSKVPIVRPAWVLPGTHITAVGSDFPEKQELDAAVLGKADKVVADHREQCLRVGEIHHAVEKGALPKEAIYAELGEVAAGLKPGRESDEEITVADLTGVGVQDAAVANRVVREALARGLGSILDV